MFPPSSLHGSVVSRFVERHCYSTAWSFVHRCEIQTGPPYILSIHIKKERTDDVEVRLRRRSFYFFPLQFENDFSLLEFLAPRGSVGLLGNADAI